jgi:hypothetical protein
MYDHLSRDEVGVSFSRIWRSKLPKKIKIFMWLLEQKAILTKDNHDKAKVARGTRLLFLWCCERL